MDSDPDPRQEIEVDPDPDLDPERGLKWIRIRPNARDPDPKHCLNIICSMFSLSSRNDWPLHPRPLVGGGCKIHRHNGFELIFHAT